MSTATYLQRGETWDYINSGTTPIEPGTVVVLGDRIGVVGGGGAGALQPGQLGIVETTGIWQLVKSEGEEIAQGAIVYYDESADCATTESGDVIAGRCAWPSAEDDPIVLVDIKAPACAPAAEAPAEVPPVTPPPAE